MTMRVLFPLLFLCAFTPLRETAIVASENRFDATGTLDRLTLGPGWVEMGARVTIPVKGWGKSFAIEKSKCEYVAAKDVQYWRARVGDGERVDIEIVQTATESASGVRFEFVASAFKECEIEGVTFQIDLPSELFANGAFDAVGRDGGTGELPAELPEKRILRSGILDSVRLENPDKTVRFDAKFGSPVNATLQDNRQWSKHFSILVYIHQGPLLKGQSAKLSVTLSAAGAPERVPAEFTVDPAKPLNTIQGIGGNYCFTLDTPETNYTFAELKPQFARTEISLKAWQTKRGAPPTPAVGKLPREFEMMRGLSRRKIPFIASIWDAPDWACQTFDEPGKDAREKDKKVTHTGIRPDAWPDVIDAVGSYLLHAKTAFAAKPDFFSFNETDWGAKIKLTPDEHRDLIKRAGALFEKLGLKTKCLLGDVSNPRVSHDFLKPSIDDPDAMKYVGALAFHSWGGGTPEIYAGWSELAKQLKLPLIVAEAGVDPGAWMDKSYLSFDYGIREMQHYQELFQFARPQAILYWEYTADYSLMAASPKGAAEPRMETERFALQKHWLQFIPPGSEGLATTGVNARVQFTAFRSVRENVTHYTFNLSNTAWPRNARITGIPPDVKSLNVVQTTRGKMFEIRAPVTPVNGVVDVELPDRSLMTLTTMDVK